MTFSRLFHSDYTALTNVKNVILAVKVIKCIHVKMKPLFVELIILIVVLINYSSLNLI